MYFEYRVKDIDNKKGVVRATKMQRGNTTQDEIVEWRNGPIFGADGAFSAVRMSMLYMYEYTVANIFTC